MDLAFQLVAVIAVLGSTAAAAWLLRRRSSLMPNSKQGQFAIEGRLQLTPQHGVYIVRLQEQRLIIATHPSGCSLIRAESRPGDVA